MASTPSLDLGSLQTESRNPRTKDIDVVTTAEMCRMINLEDATISASVGAEIDTIARVIDGAVSRVRQGGRVIQLGAGTSGRLGVLDASEIPPTYSAPPGLFVGLIAGGDHALRHPIEGAEDSRAMGQSALQDLSPPLNKDDVVIGIASSGRTPYVLGALEYAKLTGCFVAGIACVFPSALRTEGNCDEVIECVVGSEVVTGSTRMKAGTATKMILNMISSGVMIRSGKTYGNLMIDVKTSNQKLVIRARGILRTILLALPEGDVVKKEFDISDDSRLDSLIQECGGSVKLAAVVARWGCTFAQGQRRLDAHGGILKAALINEHFVGE